MRMLMQDGVKYLFYKYKDERELERMVFEHSEMIFGQDSVLFPRQKIKGRSGITSTPDVKGSWGQVLIFEFLYRLSREIESSSLFSLFER